MACNPTTIQLSSTGTTTINLTLSSDPGDGTSVTLEVDGLGVSEAGVTSSGAVTLSVDAQTAANYSLWDATIQVGSNLTVDATAEVVETNGPQTIGVTITDAAVSYCSPLGGGGGTGTVTGVLGTAPIVSDGNNTTPTISLADVSPSPAGDFTNADITVDAKGRVTAAVNGSTESTALNGPVLFTAKNRSGGTLTRGQVVFISGHSGNETEVQLAEADVPASMPAFGLVNDASSTDNSDVVIATFGTISGMNTSAFSEGDTVYVSTTAGELVSTPPSGEASQIQNMGQVVRSHATEGIIKVIGAGRSNATPNLDDGDIFIGNGSNQATTAALSGLVGVTSVDVTGGTGITSSGGPVTSSGAITVDLDDTAVTAGSYNAANVTVDAQGRITAASGGKDAYTGQVVAPANSDVYTIDPAVVSARTIVNFYARTGGGSCTATLKNDTSTVATISVTTSSGFAGVITSGAVADGDPITIEISNNTSSANLVFQIEYTL